MDALLEIVDRADVQMVSVETVRRRHLNETNTAQDPYIATLIDAATEALEEMTNHSLVPCTRRLKLTQLPASVRLPKFPLVSVTDVKYIDPDGAEQTFGPENYSVETSARPGLLSIKPGSTIPDVSSDVDYPWRITYLTGYPEAENIPARAEVLIMQMVGSYYLQRETLRVGSGATELTDWFRRSASGLSIKRFT